MRFLIFMIPAVYRPKNGRPQPGPKFKPAPVMREVGKFNDKLRQAGALQSVDGPLPLKAGARQAFLGDSEDVPSETDGPAIDAKEVIGGYWVLEARSKRQVIDWMKRCPAQGGDIIEIRQVA